MATRRERVVLDLEDNLSPGLARAALASRVLDKSLNDLGKTSTSASKEVDRVGDSSSKSSKKMGDGSKEIDKLSGRLKVLRDVAILLGPAVVPLGAASIPLLTGSLVAMGAAAGGIGASVLALKGVGDGLKAIDAYQLEPTADTLQAMRIEMEKLGPAGAHFVQYLDGIEGQLSQLQIAAREGLLPGLEDGIDSALQRLPGVRKVIRELAEGMGELASAAGGDLAPGGDWDNFFQYLDTDGKKSVVSFGNAIGDIANGLADMLVAFAPLSRSFTGGFEDMAQSFADWAAGLGESQDFQDFLRYIQVNGPKALDLLGSLVHTFAAIVEAAAPVGALTLPILTKFLDLIGALAASPLGTPFIIAVASITAYSRAMDIAAASQARFSGAKLAASGPGLAVAAITIGIAQIAAANDDLTASIQAANDAMESGDTAQMQASLQALRDDLDATAEAAGEGDGLAGIWKQSTAAGIIFGGGAKILGSKLSFLTGETDDAATAIQNLESELESTDGITALVAASLGLTAKQFRVATGDAKAFTGALAELNGWLDKRQALRDYRDGIKGLGKELRNGFGRKDIEAIDQVGRNITQVASQIKDKTVRAQFLEGALSSLQDLAKNAGPKGRAEIQKLINKMTELGLIQPKPKVDPDTTQADKKTKKIKDDFAYLNKLTSRPKIEADDSQASLVIRRTRLELSRIPDETVRINVIRSGHGGGTTDPTTGGAAPRASSASSPFDPRISARGSIADINGSKADLFGGTLNKAGFGGTGNAADQASDGLRRLRAALARAEAAVDKETRKRDALVSKMDDIRGNIRGDLSGSLFESSSDPWAAGASAMDPFGALQARKARALRFLAAIKALRKKGLAGAALQEVLGEGLEAAEFMASQSAAALGGFSAEYATTAALIGQTAEAGANAAYGAQLAEQTSQLQSAVHELREIKQAIKAAEKSNKDGHKGTQGAFASGMGFAGHAGKRRAHT